MRVLVDDTWLWMNEVGAGSPCLVLHGGLGIDHNAYRGLDVLAGDLQLVYYDHRCHGRSGDAPLESLTVTRLAEDADELRARLGHDKVGVLGHSWGGFIAYEYAALHPERIAFLIIVASSPSLEYLSQVGERFDARLTPEMRSALERPPADSEEWREVSKALLPVYFHHWRPEYATQLWDGVAQTSRRRWQREARVFASGSGGRRSPTSLRPRSWSWDATTSSRTSPTPRRSSSSYRMARSL